MIEKLRERLDFELVDCKFTRRDNLDFLDIEIDFSKLVEIEEKSKIISNILDEIDKSSKKYYLNVYSSGREREIHLKDLNNYTNKFIRINLLDSYLDKHQFEGELIEFNNEIIRLKINIKGCFRKINFQISNIKNIWKSIKLVKTEKE